MSKEFIADLKKEYDIDYVSYEIGVFTMEIELTKEEFAKKRQNIKTLMLYRDNIAARNKS